MRLPPPTASLPPPPVPGRVLHPLKSSAFHGVLLRQLFKNLLQMPFPRRVLQVRQHCAGVLPWLYATLCTTCTSPPDAVSRKRDFAKNPRRRGAARRFRSSQST